jgi:hypothetical protein
LKIQETRDGRKDVEGNGERKIKDTGDKRWEKEYGREKRQQLKTQNTTDSENSR